MKLNINDNSRQITIVEIVENTKVTGDSGKTMATPKKESGLRSHSRKKSFALLTTIVAAALAVLGLTAVAAPANAATTIAAPVITSPANGTVTNSARPSFSGTGIPGDNVTLSLYNSTGGSLGAGGVPVGSNGSWSVTWISDLSSGSYTFVATQYDATGDTSANSNSVTVNVTSTPTLAAPVIKSPANGTVVTLGSTAANTSTPSVTFSGTGIPGASVFLSNTGGTWYGGSAATVNSNGTWSIVATPQAAGSFTFTATQQDAAGNISAVSNAVTITAQAPSSATVAILQVVHTAAMAVVVAVGSVLKLLGLWN